MFIDPWPKSIKSEFGECWTPTEKLPDCPICKEDELSMLHEEVIFCNYCAKTYYKDSTK